MEDETSASGLVVVVAAAEPVVGRHRELMDSSARLGVPAHVTVLFPFAPPEQITTAVVQRLREVVGTVAPFDVELAETSWFGEDVLWLAPRDPGPFRRLTELVHGAFPDFPPFAGEFAEVVPHLTIGHGHDPVGMRAAEREIAPQLPVTARVDVVTLMTQARPGGRWTRSAELPLAACVAEVNSG
jgi:2'-5' RNA ligase